MKKRYYFLIASVALFSTYALLQNGSKSFEDVRNPIAKELEEWDPVRGQWLAESLEAMSENRSIPDRMFPEDLTPYQMISLLPDNVRNNLAHLSRNNDIKNLTEGKRWEPIRAVVEPVKSDCGTLSARTYGDPHIVTFDGARYSFQTVGEFVLTRSNSGMEIQTRQKPEKEDFSLNTAIAMSVGGDRVGIYASDYPDINSSTPIRVNGQAVMIDYGGKYFLPNGGIIRKTGSSDYRVDWPSGESITAEIKTSSGMRFINVNINVSKCGGYNGLLGNANGNQGDDMGALNDQASIRIPIGGDVFTGSSRKVEQSRLAYLANEMGDRFRVTPSTSLFDYPPGTSTYTFTDRTFPRVHRTLEEISQEQRAEARRICQAEAIESGDMNGCIFDQVYLELEPSREPVSKDPTAGVVLKPIRNAVPNVNPKPIRPTLDNRRMENVSNTSDPLPLPINVQGTTEADRSTTELRDQLLVESLIDQREEEERIAHKLEGEERDRQERLENEREEAEEYERDQLEREEEREREENERVKRQEREAAELAESDRIERKREEAERAAEKEAEERQEAREEAERDEQLKREARKKAEDKAKAEAERKKREDARKKKDAAEKKAREEAARKAKEAAAKKEKEEALRQKRDGLR